MKNNKVILYALLLLLLPYGAAKGQGFDQVYSFSPYPDQSVYSYWQSIYADSQMIYVAGQTFKDSFEDPTTINNMAVLTAFDHDGVFQWEKQMSFAPPMYAATGLSRTHLITKAEADKFVLVGYGLDCVTDSVPGTCFPRPFLYFFNAAGDSLNFVPLPHGNVQNVSFPNTAMADDESNIIVSGRWSNKPIADTVGIWLTKVAPSGSVLWRKTILNQEDVSLAADAYKVINCNDGSGYLMGGEAGTTDSSKSMFSITKTDTDGNLLWQKNLPRATFQGHGYNWLGSEQFFDIIPANSGSGYYFMAADLQRVEFPGEGTGFLPIYYCGKLDEEGEVVWAKTYKRDTFHKEECMGLKQQPNGDLVFLGKSSWNGPWSEEGQEGIGASLFSTDSLGNVKWFRVLRRYLCPYSIGHVMHGIDLTPQGGIALGGAILQNNPQPGCYDTADAIAWLILTDSMGHRDPSDTATFTLDADSVVYPADTTSIVLVEDRDKPQLRLYPNPAGNTVYAELVNLLSGNGKAMLHLYDHLGRQLKQEVLQSPKTAVDISAYPPGLYYIRLRYQDKDVGGYKLVKE